MKSTRRHKKDSDASDQSGGVQLNPHPIHETMNQMQPKYEFYEKVQIISKDCAQEGELGAILGRSANDKGGWFYSVSLYSEQICYLFAEEALESTGEFASRDEFYAGDSVRVRVDERGGGKVVE